MIIPVVWVMVEFTGPHTCLLASRLPIIIHMVIIIHKNGNDLPSFVALTSAFFDLFKISSNSSDTPKSMPR